MTEARVLLRAWVIYKFQIIVPISSSMGVSTLQSAKEADFHGIIQAPLTTTHLYITQFSVASQHF